MNHVVFYWGSLSTGGQMNGNPRVRHNELQLESATLIKVGGVGEAMRVHLNIQVFQLYTRASTRGDISTAPG